MIARMHNAVFGTVERLCSDWLLGLYARFVFLAVVFNYYLASAMTKVGVGLTGFFKIQDGAFFQIVPWAMEAANYNTDNVAPVWHYVVAAGTYTEFVLPVLIVIGLFTRIAAVGMLAFILVQSYVDIMFHAVDAETIGSWFDRDPGSVIMDQRLLWSLILVYLAIKGAGSLSLDRLLTRNR